MAIRAEEPNPCPAAGRNDPEDESARRVATVAHLAPGAAGTVVEEAVAAVAEGADVVLIAPRLLEPVVSLGPDLPDHVTRFDADLVDPPRVAR